MKMNIFEAHAVLHLCIRDRQQRAMTQSSGAKLLTTPDNRDHWPGLLSPHSSPGLAAGKELGQELDAAQGRQTLGASFMSSSL